MIKNFNKILYKDYVSSWEISNRTTQKAIKRVTKMGFNFKPIKINFIIDSNICIVCRV